MLTVDPVDREKLIDPLFRSGLRFWLIFAILFVLVAWGVAFYVRQILFGLGETGMDRPAYWGVYMVNFIFFIGISYAGTLISAILRITGAEWRRPITRVAEAITAIALVVGTLQIIIDMGRPERLWFVFPYGRLQSPILWDVVAITMYFMASVVYLYLPMIPDMAILRDNSPAGAPAWQVRLYRILSLGWRGNRTQWLRLEKAISVMAVLIIPIAVSAHSVISWILATTVQPGWHSSIMGPYFVVGAIFSGIGALFLAMSAVRRLLNLEIYITGRQYRNLALLFITMTAIWAYFTYAEQLGVAAAQQTEEFPVLASKLWGEFAIAFWGMIILMIVAFWILVVPQLVPASAARLTLFQPRFALASAGVGGALAALLVFPQAMPINVALADWLPSLAWWVLVVILLIAAGLGVSPWLKARPIAATGLASVCVLVAMWLERWNIIVPTMTHARLVPYSIYRPTLTEWALAVGSLALFFLMFLIFFKLFPAISIWEVAEGRVIAEAHAQIEIPHPEPVRPRRTLGRFGIKK